LAANAGNMTSAQAGVGKVGRLQVVEGFVANKSFQLSKQAPFKIGRTRRCELPIMSRRVSRNHSEITCRSGVFMINDLGSKSGTWVNGKRVNSTILRNNDLIQVADVKIRFLLEKPDKAAAEAPAQPLVTPPKPTPPPLAPPEKETESDLDEIEVPEFSDEELKIVDTAVGGVKLIAPLAKGRRTLIYKGIHSGRNRVVAFKMLNAEAMKDPAVVRWFVHGTERSGQLHHEDTVVALGGGREGSILYTFSPFMERATAQERFAGAVERGLAAVKRVLESLVHVTRALEFGKSKGILHLGLRPSKILYNENRRAKLAGLGYDNGPDAPGPDVTPEIAAYLAPEQVSNTGEISSATDIYSLGATCCYMLTGRLPKRDMRHRIPSPKEINQFVPDSICRIIEKMVAPVPSKRYKTYGQLIHDVRWALRGEAWPRARLPFPNHTARQRGRARES